MRKDEMEQLLEDIQALWPRLDINQQQAKLWCDSLVRYDRIIVKAGIEEHYRISGKAIKPDLNRILEYCRSKQAAGKKDCKVVTDFEIMREDNPRFCDRHSCNESKLKGVSTDRRMDNANSVVEKFNRMYGKKHYAVLVYDENNPPTEDSKIMTREQKLAIDQKILNGPDCLGKRFLQRIYKQREFAKLTNRNEPPTLGDALHQKFKQDAEPQPAIDDSDIPF